MSTLNWSSTNATTCAASTGWSGTKSVTGTEQVGPLSATTTYTLECTGTGGTTSRSATVTVSTAGNVIVSGRIEFQRPPFNAINQGLNLDAPVVSPARQVVVEAINPTTRARVGAATVTDTSGDYSIEVPQNTSMLISARAEMVSGTSAPTWNFKVLNNTNNRLYVLDGSAFDSGTANSTRDLLAPTGWNGTTYNTTRAAAPFAILDSVYRTKELILSAAPGTTFPALNLYWSPTNRTADGCTTDGNIGTTFYTSGASALDSDNCTPAVELPAGIYILGDYAGGNGDTDEFDQHVIAHEFGHYVEDRFARSDSIGGTHGPDDRLDLRVAFGEGWGNAFSAMTLNDPVYRDSSRGITFDTGFNLESDSTTAEGWFSEASIGEILWDLFDSVNDGADMISLGFTPLYSVMTGAQRTTDAMTSIYSFASGLRATSGATQRAGINGLLAGESISSAADAFGSGESNDGGNAMALPIYTDIARNQPLNVCSNGAEDGSNELGSRRFLRLTLPSAAVLSITVQGAVGPGAPVNSQPASDPDIYIYNQGRLIDAGVTTTTQPGSSEMIQQRSYPAGVNILEVHDWIGGALPHCMTVSIAG
ncbi:hypothetical protein [Povalibacter sp.]|uniref:hypothetical protein n=1 Tax=Povalibacter sp. TaxID=1962978 RepID=UPI002F3F3398